MLKKILSLLLFGFILTSCTSYQFAYVDENMKKLDIGMTKEQVVAIMGNGYEALSAVGKESTWEYKSSSRGVYRLFFVNGMLDEWFKETPPPREVYYNMNEPVYSRNEGIDGTLNRDISGDWEYRDDQGERIRIRKDIFGNLQVDGSGGNNISIHKDIFGDLNFSGNNGKSATLKNDIFDSHIYSDSKGNKIEYGNDIWKSVLKQYDNDEQLLFICLIRKYMF